MRSQSLVLLGVLLFFASSASVFRAVDGDSLSAECSSAFQKVMGCLSYATGKANTPTKDCCSAVQGVKDSEPKCLCYVMQQAHNGSAQFKSLGVQEAKLLQLPTACQLQNASLSFCPKTAIDVNRSLMLDLWLEKHPELLGLSPGSADAAIFTNASTTATPAASTGTGKSQGIDSGGIQLRPPLAGLLMIVAAIFVFAFPAGSASMFQDFSVFSLQVVVILSPALVLSFMLAIEAIIYELHDSKLLSLAILLCYLINV
ncbi:hypothetical protein NC653_000707 [Populus alba x Populus x berolinensis]|uniref:Bifunctional inhibitor/plant lipid transfer protein/seed storage helical domain-containing protein n=1 Tax=Populus alba x Populus x berolinensis TaxID=444605 RepID=A0AAD6RL27_9ROSI|nr:hypothetical protein NC653_000707 [Populus alba x Populus x berolinensis]